MSETTQRWTHILCQKCFEAKRGSGGPITMADWTDYLDRSGPCCGCGEPLENTLWSYTINPLELTCAGRTGIHEEK